MRQTTSVDTIMDKIRFHYYQCPQYHKSVIEKDCGFDLRMLEPSYTHVKFMCDVLLYII